MRKTIEMNDYNDILLSYINGDNKQVRLNEIGDEALRVEVELARETHFAIAHSDQIATKKLLDKILSDLPATPDHDLTEQLADEGAIELPGGGTNLWWIGGSLLTLLLVVGVFTTMYIQKENKLKAVQVSALELLKPIDSFTSYDTESERDAYSLGFEAYDKEDYENAAIYFESYLENNRKDEDATFYLAISQLLSENYMQSLVNLRAISGTKDTTISRHLRWYLANTQLMNRNTEDAKNILQDIPEGNPHYSDAQKLLKQL